MHPSRNLSRASDMGESEEPSNVPHRGASSLGFYRSIPSTSGPRPSTTVLDIAIENERIPVTRDKSLPPTPHRNSSEELSRTKMTTEERTRKFSMFKFSLTAPLPKPKAKQPGKAPPVRSGGRGGAGNIQPIIPNKTVVTPFPGGSETPNSNAVPISIADVDVRQPLPVGETANPHPEHELPCVSPEGREMAIPRMKPATSGRGGAGNLHHHVLEDGVFKRIIAHEDVLIRQRREMRADKNPRRTGRGGVGNIKRSDDGHDLEQEYSAGSRSGSSASRGFARRGASTSTRSSGTTSSSGMSVDIQSFPEPLSSVLEQGGAGADVRVESDNDTYLGRVHSPQPHRTNASYAIPPGAAAAATTSHIRSGSEEVRGVIGSRSPSPPHLYLPSLHPLRSHQNKHDEARRFGTNTDTLGSMAVSIPQDAPTQDVPSGPFDSHNSRMSHRKEIPRSSSLPDPNPQRSIHQTTSHTQGTYHIDQETIASPTVISPLTPPTVSAETPPIWHSTRVKGPRHYAVDSSHLRSGSKQLDVDHVREIRADQDQDQDQDHTRDLEIVNQSQEEGIASSYSEIFFAKPMAVLLAADSLSSSGAATPLSGQSSLLDPWRGAGMNDSSSAAEQEQRQRQNEVQDRPMNPQHAGIPYLHIPPPPPSPPPAYNNRPTPGQESESESESKERPLHCDELNVSPRKPLSRMEKAILRRIEFGPNVDLSKAQA